MDDDKVGADQNLTSLGARTQRAAAIDTGRVIR